MTLHNKILPVALVAALLGGSVGALVMHSNKTAEPATQAASVPSNTAATTDAALKTDQAAAPATAASTEEQAAYREGFAEGFRSAQNGLDTAQPASRVNAREAVQPTRVVYRRARSARSSSPQRSVYYDYNNAPRQRSFWQKHRDKLTVAMGTGGGALLGGLFGGKKGAAIGALAGA